MKNAFIEGDDVQWLKDTCLKGVPLPTQWEAFQFAVLQGNEDAPHAANLYKSPEPKFDDDYYRIRFVNDGPVYCECAEYDGKTDKPKGGFNPI